MYRLIDIDVAVENGKKALHVTVDETVDKIKISVLSDDVQTAELTREQAAHLVERINAWLNYNPHDIKNCPWKTIQDGSF